MWVAESQYEVLGTRFAVRTDDPQAADQVNELLDVFRAQSHRAVRPRNIFALAHSRPGVDLRHAYRDCKSIGRAESWTGLLDRLLGEINRRAIDEMEYFGVHAGVVASGSGAVALPGASGAGKSTLVAACLRAGFDYLSDESLCIDYSTKSVIPYPKPLSLSPWSMQVLGLDLAEAGPQSNGPKVLVQPQDLGATTVRGPTDLSAVVSLDRRPGRPTLEMVPPSQVIADLLRNSFNHYKRPAEVFGLTAELARHCQGWALSYDDPVEAARLLRSEISE